MSSLVCMFFFNLAKRLNCPFTSEFFSIKAIKSFCGKSRPKFTQFFNSLVFFCYVLNMPSAKALLRASSGFDIYIKSFIGMCYLFVLIKMTRTLFSCFVLIRCFDSGWLIKEHATMWELDCADMQEKPLHLSTPRHRFNGWFNWLIQIRVWSSLLMSV